MTRGLRSKSIWPPEGDRHVVGREGREAEEPALDRVARASASTGRPRSRAGIISSNSSASPGSKIGRTTPASPATALDHVGRDRPVEDRRPRCPVSTISLEPPRDDVEPGRLVAAARERQPDVERAHVAEEGAVLMPAAAAVGLDPAQRALLDRDRRRLAQVAGDHARAGRSRSNASSISNISLGESAGPDAAVADPLALALQVDGRPGARTPRSSPSRRRRRRAMRGAGLEGALDLVGEAAAPRRASISAADEQRSRRAGSPRAGARASARAGVTSGSPDRSRGGSSSSGSGKPAPPPLAPCTRPSAGAVAQREDPALELGVAAGRGCAAVSSSISASRSPRRPRSATRGRGCACVGRSLAATLPGARASPGTPTTVAPGRRRRRCTTALAPIWAPSPTATRPRTFAPVPICDVGADPSGRRRRRGAGRCVTNGAIATPARRSR